MSDNMRLVMNDQVNDLCKKIVAESDPSKIEQLINQLRFALSEYNLRMRNNVMFTSSQVQQQQSKAASS